MSITRKFCQDTNKYLGFAVKLNVDGVEFFTIRIHVRCLFQPLSGHALFLNFIIDGTYDVSEVECLLEFIFQTDDIS